MADEDASPVNVANLRNSLFGGANGINVLNLTPGRKPSFKRSKENIEPNTKNEDQSDKDVAVPIKLPDLTTEKRPSLRKKKKTEYDIDEEKTIDESNISSLTEEKSENKIDLSDGNISYTKGDHQLPTEGGILRSMCKDRVKRPVKRPPSRSFVRKSFNLVDDLDETQTGVLNEPNKNDNVLLNEKNGFLHKKPAKIETQLTEEEKEKEVERLIEDLKAVKSGPNSSLDKPDQEKTDIENLLENISDKDLAEENDSTQETGKSEENNNDPATNDGREKSKIDVAMKKELSDGLYIDKATLTGKSFSNSKERDDEENDMPAESRSRVKTHESSFTSRFREHFWPKNSSDSTPSPDRSPRFSDKFLRKNKSKEPEEAKKPSLSSRLTSWTRR